MIFYSRIALSMPPGAQFGLQSLCVHGFLQSDCHFDTPLGPVFLQLPEALKGGPQDGSKNRRFSLSFSSQTYKAFWCLLTSSFSALALARALGDSILVLFHDVFVVFHNRIGYQCL